MADDLFLFGDNFEAILGISEEDEALEGKFTTIASDVSKRRNCCIWLVFWLH